MKKNEKIKKFNFKIGADPEFILTMQGKKVDAKKTMQLVLKKKKEFKPTDIGYDLKNYGNIGWDGSSSTAELRPSPSKKPEEVTNNMGEMLKALTKHIKICELSTISEFSSIGGHIHFEIPKEEDWSKQKKDLVHKRLSSFYLPILISENKTNLNLRIKQGYGKIEDYKIEKNFIHKDKTPGYTFEFRTPSAEWLTTEKITKATLAYLGVIYYEIINHPKNFKKFNDIIYKSEKQGQALQTLAIMEFELLTKQILNKTKKYIKTFKMYPKYQKEIEYILNAKKVIKDKQKANYNIIEGWNLLKTKKIPKKTEILSSKKKIQKIAEKTDFDLLKKVMNIHYNNDDNVSLFAETFKDRVAAFDWKLKNSYYIFGIRKGIKEIIAKDLSGKFITKNKSIEKYSDLLEVNQLFSRMNSKFDNHKDEIETTIDFITGKTKNPNENIITIGIPYEMRVKENLKPFLSLIWKLEKDNSKRVSQIKEKDLIDDLESSEKGKLHKILTTNKTTPNEVILDNDSYSLNSHRQALNELIVNN